MYTLHGDDHAYLSIQGIYKIMCSCWEIEPNERPTFDLLQQLLSKSFGEWMRGREEKGREEGRCQGNGGRRSGKQGEGG